VGAAKFQVFAVNDGVVPACGPVVQSDPELDPAAGTLDA
jgi:hypothetical protein